jgi:two-component system, NarL family, response regulator DesR
MTAKISVLVVDDSDDLASMLILLIGDEPDMTCIGRLPSADALLDTVAQKKPDVVLLDLTMPGRDPLDAMAESSARSPESRVIVLSGYDDPARVDQALDRGAWGFVSKNGDLQAILTAIRTVASGDLYVNPNP